ncbi:MAG TPA: glycosyl hydrolase family 28-related protein [Armatimonadota bacterium]|jgi:hypothetical protein
MTRTLALALLLLFVLAVGVQAQVTPQVLPPPQIPTLNWQPRSDWINVKTIPNGAKGDGVTDDTAAIQRALNQLVDGLPGFKTVYFPAGTYLITQTLTLTRLHGILLIGTGRTTTLKWGGEVGGIMLTSNGSTYSRYVGLTWDGDNTAAVGFDHHSKIYYETRIRHQHENYKNFTESGIRVGKDPTDIASAEMYYDNCLFQNCAAGISFLYYNDYDNDIAGCEFYDCGIGINCAIGNVYVRDCHFERSTESDIWLCPHSQSIRRCTSIGSAQFIMTAPSGASTCEMTVQDCRIDRWTNLTGAITNVFRGPVTVMDTVFTNPPNTHPPITMINGTYSQQIAMVSNVRALGCSGLVDTGLSGSYQGLAPGTALATIKSPTRRFLKSTVPLPGVIYDAKIDFGAVGDNVTDDTNAIEACITAARLHGQGALAYIPAGYYKLTRTINITGVNYYIGGAGFYTQLYWSGLPGGVMFTVTDPHRITLEHFAMEGPDSVAKIVQTCSGATPTRIKYDGVYTWVRGLIGRPNDRGLELVNLPANATVLMDHWDGSVNSINSSQAIIFSNVSYEGIVRVSGTSPHTGFFGFNTRVTAVDDDTLVVNDNQDVVMGNWYMEQAPNSYCRLQGSPALPPGRVTIKPVRAHAWGTGDNILIKINDYNGRVAFLGGQFDADATHNIVCTGTAPLDLTFAGNMWWLTPPVITAGSNVRLTLFQNICTDTPLDTLPNVVPPGGRNGVAVAAMDDLRVLGQWDQKLNWNVPLP